MKLKMRSRDPPLVSKPPKNTTKAIQSQIKFIYFLIFKMYFQ